VKIEIATTEQQRKQCYHIRSKVFVEEQNVPLALELDEHDEGDAVHFLGMMDGVPAATARIRILDRTAKIQRVAVLAHHRGDGFGRVLMQFIIDHVKRDGLATSLVLDAQTHVTGFYENLGFQIQGDVFDDAGIPHVTMIRAV